MFSDLTWEKNFAPENGGGGGALDFKYAYLCL